MHSCVGSSFQCAQYPDQLRPHRWLLRKPVLGGLPSHQFTFLLNVLFGFIQTFCLVIAHLIFSVKFHLALSASTVMVNRPLTDLLHRTEFQQDCVFINHSKIWLPSIMIPIYEVILAFLLGNSSQ